MWLHESVQVNGWLWHQSLLKVAFRLQAPSYQDIFRQGLYHRPAVPLATTNTGSPVASIDGQDATPTPIACWHQQPSAASLPQPHCALLSPQVPSDAVWYFLRYLGCELCLLQPYGLLMFTPALLDKTIT